MKRWQNSLKQTNFTQANLWQKQPPEVFYKKAALKNFAIFTAPVLKTLLNKVVGFQAI